MDHIKLKKIHFENFRIFSNATIICNSTLNIFVGDNGTGKSSILQAIDLAISGSITKFEAYGIENLLNISAVAAWQKAPDIGNLPTLIVELFFENMSNEPKWEKFYGEQFASNPNKESAFGIKLVCSPNPDFSKEIVQHIHDGNASIFPYEFYMVKFSTFADITYSPYMKPFHLMNIDNSIINTERALRYIVSNTYVTSITQQERTLQKQSFRSHIEKYELPKAATENGIFIDGDLENCLDLKHNGIRLNNQGQGKINICKTESALHRDFNESSVFLIEEPENHLSHLGLKFLIERIGDLTNGRQLFITTHSSYITARLGLKNVFFVNKKIQKLSSLSADTSRFFMKVPNDNLLQFVLSPKVLLVEGAAEYILMDSFIQKITGSNAAQNGVWIIALNNLSFRRYMELGGLIGTKIAAIRDNDHSTEERYNECLSENIQMFTDKDENRYTFEVCLYQDNHDILDKELHSNALNYMLMHKAEAAFKILDAGIAVNVPAYIEEAIRWIL